MAGPEIIPAVQLGVAQGQALVNNALQSIRQLRQAYIDVILQPEVLKGFQQQLRDIQAKFEPLSQFRLKSAAAQTAVNRLLDTVASVLKEIAQQKIPPPHPVKRVWQAVCICVAGPSERTRRLQLWQEQVKGAVESVEKEKDNLQPQLWLHQLESLPDPCVTNHSALKQLVNTISNSANSIGLQAVTTAPSSSSMSSSAAASAAAAGPPCVVQLLGLAGMGKSTLALQAALELDKGTTFTGGVYFLRIDPKPADIGDAKKAAAAAAMEVQRALLRRLRFAERAKDAATVLDFKADLAAVFAESAASYLLVLDDVWDSSILEALRCPAMQGVILVTARSSMGGSGGGSAVHTLQLQPDEGSRQAAADLMQELLQDATTKHQDQAVAIINSILNRCDGHLLAVDIMGRALRQYKTTDAWQDVADQFLLRLEKSAPQSQIVFSALQTAVDTLGAACDIENQAAVKAFHMLQHLQSRCLLPAPLLQLLWSWVFPNEQVREVEPLLQRLVETSLLHRQGGCFLTHSLVDDFMQNQHRVVPQAVECALPAGYRSPRTLIEAPTSCQQQSEPIRSLIVPSVRPQQLGVPDTSSQAKPAQVAPPALLKLAVLLLGYGKSHAVHWAQQLLGVEPVDATALTYLGSLPDWAREDSPDEFAWEPEGNLCSRLGLLLKKSGRYMQAEPWLREALAICQKVLGPDHQDTASSFNNLAGLLRAQGKLEEAETMCWKALAIRHKVLGPEHPDIASSLNNLAGLLRAQGKLAEAETMCRETWLVDT